jgi:hypothetical protein
MSAAADGDGEASPPVAEQCQETQQCITSTGEVRPAASPTEELLCVTEELLLVLDATPVPDGLQLDDERHVVVAIAVDAPRVFPQRCWTEQSRSHGIEFGRAMEASPVPRSEILICGQSCNGFFVGDHTKTGGFCPFPFRRGVPLLFKGVPRPVRSTGCG